MTGTLNPATDTKTQILDAAERLVREQGFNGFSYKDIAGPLGIRNAAVHYHFASKGDLGVALIQRYRQILEDASRNFLEGGGRAVRQIEALIWRYDRACREHMVCPISMVATDYYTISEPMRTAGRKLAEELIHWMTRVLELGREQGEFRFEGPAPAKALEVLAALQGAVQLARLVGRSAYEDTTAQIRRDLGYVTRH